jgi:hypothetical protein
MSLLQPFISSLYLNVLELVVVLLSYGVLLRKVMVLTFGTGLGKGGWGLIDGLGKMLGDLLVDYVAEELEWGVGWGWGGGGGDWGDGGMVDAKWAGFDGLE